MSFGTLASEWYLPSLSFEPNVHRREEVEYDFNQNCLACSTCF